MLQSSRGVSLFSPHVGHSKCDSGSPKTDMAVKPNDETGNIKSKFWRIVQSDW